MVNKNPSTDVARARSGRPAIAVVGVLLVLASVFGGFAAALTIGLGTCGGDGGAPYAGRGSQRDRLCHSMGSELTAVEMAGLPLIAVVATVLACMRRRFRPLLVGVGLVGLTFLGPFVLLTSASTKTKPPPCQWYDLTSDYCS